MSSSGGVVNNCNENKTRQPKHSTIYITIVSCCLNRLLFGLGAAEGFIEWYLWKIKQSPKYNIMYATEYHACNSNIMHATAVSRMQRQYHACNGNITHATAISHMQQQYHACNDSITHATTVSAVSHMQQQYHACNSSITHATAVSRMQQHYHSCNSTITHATAVSRMQQHYHACNSSNIKHATAAAMTRM